MILGMIGLGKMGQLITTLAKERGHLVLPFGKAHALTADPDLFIDFSSPKAVLPRLKEAIALNKPILIGTTGWEEALPKARELVIKEQGTALYAPNFSLGVLRFMQLLRVACDLFPSYDKGGIDTHHLEKKDAPSGTAKAITSKYHIPFSSVRLGSAHAKLDVMFDSPVDTITLSHAAKSRAGFANGALDVATWLISQTGWKSIDDYLHSTDHPL